MKSFLFLIVMLTLSNFASASCRVEVTNSTGKVNLVNFEYIGEWNERYLSCDLFAAGSQKSAYQCRSNKESDIILWDLNLNKVTNSKGEECEVERKYNICEIDKIFC